MIEANVIEAAFRVGVKKLLFLGSSCIYPREVPQPMPESALLSAKLEPTNEPYALAKIAGIKLCESFNRQYRETHGVDYRSVMPCNLYGLGDNYHVENSHVIPALIRRFHEAKVAGDDEVKVWGTGKIRREFLYVNDLASACLHVMALPYEEYAKQIEPMCSHLNVGYGDDLTMAELADLVASVIGYKGRLKFDQEKPVGLPRKFIDSSRMNALGWHPNVSLQEGLKLTYEDFLKACLNER